MDIENTTLDISDDSIEKKNPESWVWVYRILALVAAWFVWYGTIRYTIDPNVSESVDMIIEKIWLLSDHLISGSEDAHAPRISKEPKK